MRDFRGKQINRMKEYRFKDNPKEQEIVEKFLQRFKPNDWHTNTLEGIIFGWHNAAQTIPNNTLTEYEFDKICVPLMQWLGSPVGIGFLNELGFELKNK